MAIIFYAVMVLADLAGIAFRPQHAVVFGIVLAWFAFRLGHEVGKA